GENPPHEHLRLRLAHVARTRPAPGPRARPGPRPRNDGGGLPPGTAGAAGLSRPTPRGGGPDRLQPFRPVRRLPRLPASVPALAKEMGAGRVIVLGRRSERLALARAFGADLTLGGNETTEEERRQCVFDCTRGQGADVVAEFAGSPQAVTEGIRLLRPGGRYLWVGNVTP